jgi:hypothetical protein
VRLMSAFIDSGHDRGWWVLAGLSYFEPFIMPSRFFCARVFPAVGWGLRHYRKVGILELMGAAGHRRIPVDLHSVHICSYRWINCSQAAAAQV